MNRELALKVCLVIVGLLFSLGAISWCLAYGSEISRRYSRR